MFERSSSSVDFVQLQVSATGGKPEEDTLLRKAGLGKVTDCLKPVVGNAIRAGYSGQILMQRSQEENGRLIFRELLWRR